MKHVQRFYVRMIADGGWQDARRFTIGTLIAKALDAEWSAGRLIADPNKPFAITELNVFPATPPTPRDGAQARREGFLYEENPYALGSRRYEAWARAYAEAATWSHHYGPSPSD